MKQAEIEIVTKHCWNCEHCGEWNEIDDLMSDEVPNQFCSECEKEHEMVWVL